MRTVAVAVAFTFALTFTFSVAFAEEEKPTEAAPPAVRVTTFLLSHPGVDDPATVPVMRALEDGLKRNPRLEMKDLDTRLADFAQEVPQEQIDEGRLLFNEGSKALTALELPAARKKLTQAIEVLGKVLPYIKKQELADAMMALAAAEFEDGDKKAAEKTLARLMTWRTDYKLDTKKYPPELIQPVEEARKLVEKAKRGSLEIRTTPAAAQAYVDGRYVGVTPTSAEGLPVGEHFITLKKEGWRKAVTAALVSSKQQGVVNVPLERSGKYLLVEQALAAMEKEVGKPSLTTAADNLKEVLFIDHAVFVRLKSSGSNIDVDSYLYDLRTRRRLTRVEKTVPAADADKQLSSLAATLYLNVSYEAELETPRDAPPPKPVGRRPVYKTWWFWTVGGALVVGAVLAGTLSPSPPRSCGATCFSISY
jgi:hypothetical protein